MPPRADPKNQLFAQTRRGQEVLTKVKQFMRQHVFPAEKVRYERVSESPSSWWADGPPFSTALRPELYRHLELKYARGCAYFTRDQREQAARAWRYEVGPYIWVLFAEAVTFNFCYFTSGCFESLRTEVSPNKHEHDLWPVISNHTSPTLSFPISYCCKGSHRGSWVIVRQHPFSEEGCTRRLVTDWTPGAQLKTDRAYALMER